ncbi:MAG: hypothetical protein KDD64_08440 [Bdellovibrionales bacterium]|nr:hypothetical protein [Bdellovibrionales bacterium]
MSHFVVLKTLVEQQSADRVCQALEDSEISVMLEHVTLPIEDDVVSGYRVYVPEHMAQAAQRVVSVCETMMRAANPSAEHLASQLPPRQAA